MIALKDQLEDLQVEQLLFQSRQETAVNIGLRKVPIEARKPRIVELILHLKKVQE